MQEVKATRSELLQLKKKVALAKNGYNLLKKKRDSLITEFFRILKESKDVLREIEEIYAEAREKLVEAELVEGATYLRACSLAVPSFPKISIVPKNIMGIKSCSIEVEEDVFTRDFLSVSARVEAAIFAYRKLILKFLEYVEKVYTLHRIVEEIDKTKRKVNALEYKIIPQLEEKLRFVRQRLEEMERENIFRLKKMKK